MAGAVEGVLGTRSLQPQLQMLVGVAFVAALTPSFARGLFTGLASPGDFDIGFALVWAVGISCALGAAYQAKFHRLAALILLGGAGLAACAGAGLATLAYAAMTRPARDTISRFFVENAYVEGGGTNIVNVILAAFRGFDTLGETTVLGVVALTVYALLRRFRPAPESIPVPEQQRAQDHYDDGHPDRQRGDTIKDAMATPGADHDAAVRGDRDGRRVPASSGA